MRSKFRIQYLVGRFTVGNGARELHGGNEDREQPQRGSSRGGGILGRQVRRDHLDDGLHSPGVGIADGVAAAADLVEKRGIGTTGAGIVAMLRGQVRTDELPQRRLALG